VVGNQFSQDGEDQGQATGAPAERLDFEETTPGPARGAQEGGEGRFVEASRMRGRVGGDRGSREARERIAAQRIAGQRRSGGGRAGFVLGTGVAVGTWGEEGDRRGQGSRGGCGKCCCGGGGGGGAVGTRGEAGWQSSGGVALQPAGELAGGFELTDGPGQLLDQLAAGGGAEDGAHGTGGERAAVSGRRAREDRAKKTGQAGGGVDQNTAGTEEKTGSSGDCVGKVCSFVSVNTHFVR
jgi:hypothetical protein